MCQKCGGRVPHGYVFCSTCGNAIVESQEQEIYATNKTAYKPKDSKAYNSNSENKKTANNSNKGLIAALIVLCCLLAAGLVFEYSQVMIANTVIEKLEQDRDDKAERIAEMQIEIADLQNTVNEYKRMRGNKPLTVEEIKRKYGVAEEINVGASIRK